MIGFDCLITHDLCLTSRDLSYLLDTFRESSFKTDNVQSSENKSKLNKSPKNLTENIEDDSDTAEPWSMNYITKNDSAKSLRIDDFNKSMKNAKFEKESYSTKQSKLINETIKYGKFDKSSNYKDSKFTMIYPTPHGRLFDKVI